MVLFFTALHEQKKIKIFSFQPGSLELGLDFINIVSAQGDSILSAHVVDENGATEIPLEVFDGRSFSAPIHALEKQWTKLLRKPVKRDVSPHTKELIGLLRKRIQLHAGIITNFESTIMRLEELLLQANKVGSVRLLNHYTTLIHKYRQSITKAQDEQKTSVDKLHQLQHK